MNKERFQIRVAVFIVVLKNQKILLQKRVNTNWMDEMYDTPSGHMEDNESPFETAVRELYEETGLVCKPHNCKLLHTMYAKFESYSYIQFYVGIDNYTGVAEVQEPDKCGELLWSDLNSLPDNTVPYLKQALENIGSNNSYSEYFQN